MQLNKETETFLGFDCKNIEISIQNWNSPRLLDNEY